MSTYILVRLKPFNLLFLKSDRNDYPFDRQMQKHQHRINKSFRLRCHWFVITCGLWTETIMQTSSCDFDTTATWLTSGGNENLKNLFSDGVSLNWRSSSNLSNWYPVVRTSDQVGAWWPLVIDLAWNLNSFMFDNLPHIKAILHWHGYGKSEIDLTGRRYVNNKATALLAVIVCRKRA